MVKEKELLALVDGMPDNASLLSQKVNVMLKDAAADVSMPVYG